MVSAAPFALALLRLDGVGRVTAHRVLEHFASPEALRATPREQVLLRLKSAPRADSIVERLFGDELDEAMVAAAAQVSALAPKRVAVLASGDAAWPTGLDALPPADRPVAIWAYGHVDAMEAPALALLGRVGLAPAAFEAATRLATQFASGGIVTGAKDGFDLAVQKPAMGAGGRVVAVAPMGLARLTPSLRPGATAVVRAGGVLVSPFPMSHGPFEHDEREAALMQAALAQVAVGAAPEAGSPEARALEWASGAGRAAFALASGPEGVPVLGADMDAVIQAAR
ncbi:DNA-processing protein DprA [Rubricoccus marinus]|uniref:Smf/DprA SLOG domain-containing protein n=1 Tax=Rubricoccus marinus TaxID=716817 RepID=A0A259U0G2_9BACT|nr:DNA-processing protein DprA [Rubricoccus marinus]OZC03492.1 hypothetical protein BSZ36_11165 [Rubricoccus marinus]